MAQDWKRVGALITARRRLEYRTQAHLAVAAGVSKSTISSLERGTQTRYSPGTLTLVEAALKWENDSIMRTANGGNPEPHTDPYLARVRDAWPKLEEQTKKVVVELIEAALRKA